MVGAEIEALLSEEKVGDLAIAVTGEDEFGAAGLGFLAEGGGPFAFAPGGGDGIGREDEEDEIGIEAVIDIADEVIAGFDLRFIEPDLDGGGLGEMGGEFADEGFVFTRMGKKDGGHVTKFPSDLIYGSAELVRVISAGYLFLHARLRAK